MTIVQQLNEDIVSLKGEMNDFTNSDSFDDGEFSQMTKDMSKLKAKLKLAKDVAQEEAQQHMADLEDDNSGVAQEPLHAGQADAGDPVGHATKVKPAYENDDKLGFSSGGELIADVINYTCHGHALDVSNDQRLKNYLNSTNTIEFSQAAGTASTLTDGIEIIPSLLPGIKEYGPGTFQEMLNMFSPQKSNVDFIDYYFDPKTYTVDGLTVQRLEEDGTLTPQTTSNKLGKLELFGVGVLAKMTRKAMRNIPLLETRYLRQAPTVIMIQKLIDIISGDGIRKPVGFNTAANTARVLSARATVNTIVFADLANMEKRLFRQGGLINAGIYFTNQSTLAQLMLLADDSGALIWKSSRDMGVLGSPIQGFLNGRPLIVSEDMEALGTAGDLALINPDGYLFAEEVAGVEFAESRHFYFDQAATGLRWIDSYGGKPYFNTAYTPRKGGETLTHFVVLDA